MERSAPPPADEVTAAVLEPPASISPQVRELFDASFIPGVRAPMCVGLGNPEMRTLITFEGEASGSTAAAVA